MISSKRLLQLARKWRKMAALGRRTNPWLKPGDAASLNECHPLMPPKGAFVVYSQDGKRFAIPLEYINTGIIKELLEISKEEFGIPCSGPIVMPFDAAFMECIVSLLSKRVPKDVEKALLSTLASAWCSVSSI